jgi:hypothetical protein
MKSLLDLDISPFKQLMFIFLLMVVMMGLTSVFPETPYSKNAHLGPWVVVCAMLLFYSLTNCILSFGTSSSMTYYLHSIISFALLLVVGGVIAWQISGVNIDDAGSMRWLYIVMTFSYLVLLSIVNLIKFLVYLSKVKDSRA